MSWELWWLFVLTEAAMSLTPGPAVLMVISQGLGPGVRASIAANLGILSGNFVYFALSAAGLSALVLAWPLAFEVLRWAGVLYLCGIGLGAVLGHSQNLRLDATENRESFARVWRRALLLQLANPKALVFFTALLPQFVRPEYSIVTQMSILTVTSVVIEFWILLGYGYAAARAARFATDPKVASAFDRLSGALLIVAALLTATIGLT